MYGLVRVTETTEGRKDGREGNGKEKFCCVKWAPEDGTAPQRTPELQVSLSQGKKGMNVVFFCAGVVWPRVSVNGSVFSQKISSAQTSGGPYSVNKRAEGSGSRGQAFHKGCRALSWLMVLTKFTFHFLLVQRP